MDGLTREDYLSLRQLGEEGLLKIAFLYFNEKSTEKVPESVFMETFPMYNIHSANAPLIDLVNELDNYYNIVKVTKGKQLLSIT